MAEAREIALMWDTLEVVFHCRPWSLSFPSFWINFIIEFDRLDHIMRWKLFAQRLLAIFIFILIISVGILCSFNCIFAFVIVKLMVKSCFDFEHVGVTVGDWVQHTPPHNICGVDHFEKHVRKTGIGCLLIRNLYVVNNRMERETSSWHDTEMKEREHEEKKTREI